MRKFQMRIECANTLILFLLCFGTLFIDALKIDVPYLYKTLKCNYYYAKSSLALFLISINTQAQEW